LNRHAEGLIARHRVGFGIFQARQQGRAVVPRHGGARNHDIVAAQRRYRDTFDVRDPERSCKRTIFIGQRFKKRLVVFHQVHLVDGQHQAPNTQ
jgi:hypothetical protein